MRGSLRLLAGLNPFWLISALLMIGAAVVDILRGNYKTAAIALLYAAANAIISSNKG